jgi:hypothetical protein
MVRKMGEFPKFLVFNSRTKSFGNRSVFAFYLLLFTFIQNSVFALGAFDRGLVTLLCLRFRWSQMITLTFTSLRMGDCVLQAYIARGSQECCTTHSSALVTMGTLRSTVVDCPGFMTWTGVRLASRYHLTRTPMVRVCHRPHLPVRGPPRSYSGTTYRASPDSESGEPCMTAVP